MSDRKVYHVDDAEPARLLLPLLMPEGSSSRVPDSLKASTGKPLGWSVQRERHMEAVERLLGASSRRAGEVGRQLS